MCTQTSHSHIKHVCGTLDVRRRAFPSSLSPHARSNLQNLFTPPSEMSRLRALFSGSIALLVLASVGASVVAKNQIHGAPGTAPIAFTADRVLKDASKPVHRFAAVEEKHDSSDAAEHAVVEERAPCSSELGAVPTVSLTSRCADIAAAAAAEWLLDESEETPVCGNERSFVCTGDKPNGSYSVYHHKKATINLIPSSEVDRVTTVTKTFLQQITTFFFPRRAHGSRSRFAHGSAIQASDPSSGIDLLNTSDDFFQGRPVLLPFNLNFNLKLKELKGGKKTSNSIATPYLMNEDYVGDAIISLRIDAQVRWLLRML